MNRIRSRKRIALDTALLVTLILLVKLAFDPTLGRSTPFLLFSVGVALVTYRDGFWPGLAAALGSCLLADLFFIGDPSSFEFLPETILQMAAFFAQSLVIGWAIGKLRRARNLLFRPF